VIGRARSIAPCNKHDPKVSSQIILVLAHNFAQTAPDTIADYRASEVTRSNEPDAT
jgi:hypothetical protein